MYLRVLIAAASNTDRNILDNFLQVVIYLALVANI